MIPLLIFKILRLWFGLIIIELLSHQVMEPMAHCLDTLQGDKHVSIGFLLPAMHSLLHSWRGMASNLKICGPMLRGLKDNVERR